MSYKLIQVVTATHSNIGSKLFFLPLHFNKAGGEVATVIQSKYHVICRWIFALVGSASSAVTLVRILQELNAGTFALANLMIGARLVSFILSALGSLMQWNTLLRAQEYADFWNNIKVFANDFEARNQSTMPRRGRLIEQLQLSFIFLMLCATMMALFAVIAHCNLHFYSDVFSICDADDPTKHKSFLVGLASLGFLFVIMAQVLHNFCFVGCLLLVAVVGCSRVLQEMRNQLLTGTAGKDHKKGVQWNTDYQSMQLLFGIINRCNRAWILPAFFLTVIVVMVCINYILLVVPNLKASLVASGIIMNLIFVFYLATVGKLSCAFFGTSMELIRVRRLCAMEKNDMITVKLVDAFYPFKVWIGPYFYLTRHFLPGVFEIVLSNTVNAVLTF